MSLGTLLKVDFILPAISEPRMDRQNKKKKKTL